MAASDLCLSMKNLKDLEERGMREEEDTERRRLRRPWGRRMGPRPDKPPDNWREAAALAVSTARFTYSETVGKWGIGTIAFGIKNHMRRQDDQQFARIYTGKGCLRLKGPEITAKLNQQLKLLRICMLFTRKSFRLFLTSSGYSIEDVILQEHKAGILKPNFAVLCDRSTQCFLLFIRGARSIKDRLTAATGEMVPFHHLSLEDGDVNRLVLGYAHSGMLVAAHWIAKRITPSLLHAVYQNPEYKIKIIGHSMGAGIAAMLTYILREREEFSSSTCIAYGPAACMTWNLAESGKHFITSLVNNTDLVPTLSPATATDLRDEVKSASQSNGSKKQVKCRGLCDIVPGRASTLGYHGQSMCRGNPCRKEIFRNCFPHFSWPCSGARQHSTSKKIADSLVTENETKGTRTAVVGEEFCHSTSSRPYGSSEDEESTDGDNSISVAVMLKDDGKSLLSALEGNTETKNRNYTTQDALERHHFYPPGTLMHMLVLPGTDASSEDVGIFKIPRELYSKIRLSETMILDHYMETYIKMMERVVKRLEEDDCISPL